MKLRKILSVLIAATIVLSYGGLIYADETADVLDESEFEEIQVDEDEVIITEETEIDDEVISVEADESVADEYIDSSDDLIIEEFDDDEEIYVEEFLDLSDIDFDNDAMAEQFILQEIDVNRQAYNRSYDFSSYLEETGTDPNAFNELLAHVRAVANGDETYTRFNMSNYSYTAQQLGLSDLSDDASIQAAVKVKLLNSMVNALLYSTPYELYWFNKTVGVRMGYRYSKKNGVVTVKEFVFTMTVASEYQDKEASEPEYTVNSVFGDAISAAAANVRTIITTYAGLDDYSKLLAYKNAICRLVDYNHPAVNNSYPYGNPWQMIWVFDGDAKTKVVCEGYSKAFQYLCDNSTFVSDDIYAICVSGTMSYNSTSGGHMWNIVHMNDGINYLVDVTNCDSGFSLFLVGAEGTADTSYRVAVSSSSYITYSYNERMEPLYSIPILTLAGSAYESSTVQPSTCRHVAVTDPAVPATCTQSGLTEGSHCMLCGAVLTAQQTVAPSHTIVNDPYVAPTCTQPGHTAGSHCSVCGEVIVATQPIAAGHTIVEDPAVAPTCTQPGHTAGSHCSVCGEVIVATQPIAAGHTIVEDPAVAPTCTEPGHTAGSHCSVCGEVIVATETIAPRHTIVEDPAVAPTCTQPGHTAGSHCSVCGEVIIATETIAPRHTIVEDPAVAPTCTQPGHTAGSHCSVCGEVIVATQPIAAGHTIVDDPYVAPTCTEPGHTAGSHCSVCGEVIVATQTIDAPGHTEVPDIGYPATTTSEGLTDGSHCSVCGEVIVPQEVIPKLKTGWVSENGKWYFYDDEGEMITGWLNNSNKWYYLGTNGVMATSWQKISNKWYYFGSNGVMVTGWQQVGSSWYYFENGGSMVTGWKKIGSAWYYFNGSGVMATGWQKISNKWYYFAGSGAMKTGWLKLSGKWYYFDGSGVMVTGTRKIGSKTYSFSSSGVCQNP